MTSLARAVRMTLLASVAVAVPLAWLQRQRPGIALAALLALAAALAVPAGLRRAGVPVGRWLEVLWLVPFAACWGLGEGFALFERVRGWDRATHLLGGAAVGALFLAGLARLGLRGLPRCVLALLAALAVGALWELGEYGADALLGTATQAGNADTMGDLAFDLLGASVAVGAHALRLQVRRARSRGAGPAHSGAARQRAAVAAGRLAPSAGARAGSFTRHFAVFSFATDPRQRGRSNKEDGDGD